MSSFQRGRLNITNKRKGRAQQHKLHVVPQPPCAVSHFGTIARDNHGLTRQLVTRWEAISQEWWAQCVYSYMLVDEHLQKGNVAVGDISTQLTYSSQPRTLHLMKQERSMEAQTELLSPLVLTSLPCMWCETPHLHRRESEEGCGWRCLLITSIIKILYIFH